MAAFHGRLSEFSGASDEWEIFAEQLQHYFAANAVNDDDKQRAILLSACGTATYKLLHEDTRRSRRAHDQNVRRAG